MKTNENVLQFIKKKNRKYDKKVHQLWGFAGDRRDEGEFKV